MRVICFFLLSVVDDRGEWCDEPLGEGAPWAISQGHAWLSVSKVHGASRIFSLSRAELARMMLARFSVDESIVYFY